MTEPIIRTVYQLEVFSRGRYFGHDDARMTDLEALAFDAYEEGEVAVSDLRLISSEPVLPADLEAHAIRTSCDFTMLLDEDDGTAPWPTAAEAESYGDWQREVGNGDTVRGFWDWLKNREGA